MLVLGLCAEEYLFQWSTSRAMHILYGCTQEYSPYDGKEVLVLVLLIIEVHIAS